MSMATILLDDRWIGDNGIGRFAREVVKRLHVFQSVKASHRPVHPLDPVWISWEIHRTKPDVFYTCGINAPLYSTCPFVFTIHDLNHLSVAANSTALKRAYYCLIVKQACQRAFKIITVSEFSRQSIVEWSKIRESRVVNVGNGVDSAYCPEGDKYTPDYPYLFYVGNRKPHKNIPRLLEAFKSSHVRANVKLILSGKSDKSTAQLIKNKGLEKDVVFAGVVPEAKLPCYYRGAIALVFPSLYEGFGLPVLEAMACGTAVITSDCTALPEVAGNACLLVDPLQVDEIAAAIRRVVDGTALREELRSLGPKRARHFSWEKTAAKVWKVLEEAISTSKG